MQKLAAHLGAPRRLPVRVAAGESADQM